VSLIILNNIQVSRGRPKKTQRVSSNKIVYLLLFMEVITVYQRKYTSAHCEQTSLFLDVKVRDAYTNQDSSDN
jgi:hypothetical protein